VNGLWDRVRKTNGKPDRESLETIEPSRPPALGGGGRQFPRAEQTASRSAGPAASPAEPATLERVGLRNESLRHQFEKVERGFAQIEIVKHAFREAITPIASLLAELEGTTAQLHESKIKLNLLQEAHEGLKSRHSTAVRDADSAVMTRNVLVRDVEELQQKLERAESSWKEAKSAQENHVETIDQLQRLLEIETRKTSSLTAETDRLKTALQARDEGIGKLELGLKTAQDQEGMLDQEIDALRKAISELSASLETKSLRVIELESHTSTQAQNLEELGAAHLTAQTSLAALQTRYTNDLEKHRTDFNSLNFKNGALRARAEATEKLLSEARVQLREKGEELRAGERQILENGIQIDADEKKIRTLSDDLKTASERMMSMEKMRATLVEQVNTLTRSLEERESSLRVAEQKAEQLSTRHDELTDNNARDRDTWERSIAELREKFEREHSERVLLEGALRAAREERNLPHDDGAQADGGEDEKTEDAEKAEFAEDARPLQKTA
jgi:crescentin